MATSGTEASVAAVARVLYASDLSEERVRRWCKEQGFPLRLDWLELAPRDGPRAHDDEPPQPA